MKTKNVKLLLSAAIVMLMAWALASCSKSDTPTTVTANKTALLTALDTANHYLTIGVEGTAAGDYTVGSKASLQTATAAATTVSTTANIGQTQVDAATLALNSAITAFKSALILPIGSTDLVANWKFDEGTGTTTKDASGNGHNGSLLAAQTSVGTGAVPNWVSDRAGTASKALHFTGGGHVEVPVSAAFTPAALSISLWINLDSLNTSNGIYTNNYILSQNDYHGYKFQTQEAKKPFFTVATTTAIYDRDTNDGHPTAPVVASTLSLKKWYHLVVTYAAGTETFYINGNLAKQWTDLQGDIATLTTPDLFCIGVNYSNAYYAANPFSGTNPSVFYGSLDEVKLYKVALTASQVTALYAQEKP